MSNLNPPQGPSPDHSDAGKISDAGVPDRSPLEAALVKGSMWKKQRLREIENRRALAMKEPGTGDARTAELCSRLSAQLLQRNDEIEQLRRAVSKLENEMSRRGRAHQRELELRRAELDSLQDAYDQFEKESDSLLAELTEQNERLRNECRGRNNRSLLRPT